MKQKEKSGQSSSKPPCDMGGVMKRGHYDVQVFDGNGNEVDRRCDVIAWTRREAYFDVMNEMKAHKTWDATRIKDHVS